MTFSASGQFSIYVDRGRTLFSVVWFYGDSDDITADGTLLETRGRTDGDVRQIGLCNGNGLRASLLIKR